MKFLKRLIQQLLALGSVPTDERRESVRLNLSLDIKIRVGEVSYPAKLVNLTFTGLCLELALPLNNPGLHSE